MPIFKQKDGTYVNVLDTDVDAFVKAHPDAWTQEEYAGKKYRVDATDYSEFRKAKDEYTQRMAYHAEEEERMKNDPMYLPGLDWEHPVSEVKFETPKEEKKGSDGIAPYGTPAQTAMGANVQETPAKALMNDSEGVDMPKVDIPKVQAPIKTDTVVKSPVFTEEQEENEQGALEAEKTNLPKEIAELEEKLSKGGLAAQARLSLQSQLDKKKARFEEIYAEEFDANRKAVREQTKHLREVVDKHVSDAHQQQGTWTTFPSTAGAFSVYTPTKKSVVAEQAQYNLDRVEELIANADRVAKGQTWVGGVGHGLADRATDLRTWQDLLNPTMSVEQEKVVTEAMKKADRGEKLTDEEDALLDSEALRIAAQEYFKSTWKDGYKIGEITGESLPFMVEMALNPVSKAGSAVKGLSLAVLKRYAKRYGTKEAVKQLTKRGGKRLAADIAGATAMSATTGAGGVMADAERRGRGQAQFDEDMRYIGHTEGDEHAVRNAFVARSIDNVTEMMPLFRGVTRTTQKVFKKVAPKPLREAIEGITGSEWAKHVDDFAQRTQWHGPIEEYFEEVEAGILNAALVGDQSLDEFFTVENQLETFLGVALMGATMSTVKTLGYESAKTRARKSAERLDSDMRNAMGASWDALEIDLRNPETAARVLADMRMEGSGYSQREIDAATRYAQLRAKQMGAEIGEAKLAETNPQAVAAHDSYDSGNAAVEVEQKADVEESFERADAAMREVFGENDMALLEGDNFIEVANQFVEHGADSELITNYINARSAREGMMDRLTEEIEAATANVDAEVDQVTNRETGNVQSVRMKDGSVAHVVSGEVVLREDGSVDNDNSSKNLVIFRDGKLEFTNPHMVEEASAPVNAESHKQERKSEIETAHLEATEAGIEEVRRARAATEAVETNGRVMLRGNQEGEVVEAEVLPSDEPGMVYVRGAKSVFGANVVEIPMAEYTARYAGRVRDERSAEDAQGGVVAPDVSEGSDSVASDGTEGSASGVIEGGALDVSEGGAGVEVGSGDVQGEGEAVSDATASEGVSVGASASALSRMPKTEQGEVDYAHAEPSLAAQAFLEEVEGDTEIAINLARETAEEKRKEATTLAETAPQTAGLSPSEKAKAVREHKAQVAQAEAEATQWKNIAEVLQQSQQVAEEAPTQAKPSVQSDQVGDQVEVAPQAQNEVENVTSQDENTTENVGDSKTQELTEEEKAKRREEFQQWVDSVTEVASRMAERWGRLLNVNVRVHTDVSTISNKEAVERINRGDVVDGWYEPKTGEVHVYVPGVVTRALMDGVHPTTRLEMTIRHEVVAHKGLREILGLEEYNAVMRSVWEGMNEAERKTWLAYVNGDANNVSDQIAAADEMCAHISELTEPSTREMTLFERLVQAIKDFFKKGEMTVLESEIRDLLKANYAYMREANEANKQAVLEQAERVKREAKKSTNVEESSGEPLSGAFGTIYTQFKGKAKEAIAFLLDKKEGEAVAALHHPEIGDIDLVWGKEGTGKSDGFGLAKLAKYHPEVLDNLQEILNDMRVTARSANRVQLESETHQAAVRLTWDNENKNWLLTAFEKKNSVSDNTTDTGETSNGGKRNDTATPQNTVSDSKVTDKSSAEQKNAGENVVAPVNITEAANQDTEAIKFSVATEDALGERIRDYAKSSQGKKAGWTPEKVEGIIEETRALIGAIDATMRGNEFYDAFADREPTIRTDWRDGELKPIVTWTRANIEYKYDMSADLLCVNNDGIESVLSHPRMVDIMGRITKVREKDASGKTYDLSFAADDYTMLYDILKDMGFVVPCKGCFDAAGRFKMLPSVAQKFAQDVNDVIDERNKNPKKFDKAVKAEAKGEASVEGLPVKYGDKMAAIRAGVAGDNATEHIQWTDLMSAEGQTKLLATHGGIFRAWQRTGAGRPKDKLLAEPYYGDIMAQTGTIIGAYGEKTPSFRDMSVNTGTGLRRNSHSELRPTLFVDEIQFMRDAFLKGLTVFKYTKDLDDVRMFGEMGTKFNMSFFPEHVKGTKASGLDAEGNYIAAEESVGAREFAYTGEDGKRHYDGMKGFEEAKRLVNKDVSLSSVIFSIPHLIKALTDVPTVSDKSGIWGSLIPFHSSGATTAGLAAQGLGMARANGVGHGFEEAMTDYGKGVTNFEAVQNDRFGEGWVILQGKKEGTAVEPGHKLEFVNGTHYYNEALGVHLFASGYALDSEVPADQRHLLNDAKTRKQFMHPLSIDYNERVRKINTPTAYQDAADYYLDILPKIGLVPRFQFNVAEDVFLQMCKDANVDPNHPKLGWKGEGHAWSPTDAESYYSLFCDYGMTDPATGEWAPHKPIGKVNKNGERVFELPKDAVEIAKTALDRYTEVRQSEDPKVDEAINRFEDKLKEQGRLMFSAKERANMSPAEMLERMSEGQGDDIRFSFIGEKGAEALDKAEEATTRLDNLNIAREMESAGKDARTIKIATGWERGADNKWRYETEDVKLKKDFWKKKDVTLGDVADLGELGKAYPDLKDIKVVLDTNESERRGTYSHKNNTITLYIMDANNTRKMAGAISRNIPFTKFIADYMTSSAKESVDKTLVHEIQHAIQSREGFAKGGNKRMRIGESEERLGYEGYRKLAGEVEARNVSERMGKTMDERRASLRTETQDVADEDQNFIYDALESAMGSRVDKRMADIAQHFADAELSERQRAIVDVFGGVRNNLPITIERADGSTRRVVMRQGREDRGGTKHALLRHYGTSSGNYTADELLLIEDVLANGKLTEKQRRGVTVNEYQHEIDGVRYTVVTEKKDNREEFTDFYTNRSGDTRSLNTQLSARAGHTTASSEREVTPNSVTEQDNGQENDGATLFSYKPVGGNRGYVGYSMSKRAAQAREEGRFPKTDFKKEYGVTEKVLDALVKAGIVDNAEWHHTSMYGNKTPFYGWVDDAYADVYAENKKAVKQILEGKNADGTPFAELPTENPYTEMSAPIPEGWYPFLNNLDENLTEAEREAVLIERFGDAYAKLKEASENNRLYHEYEANKGRMEREYYAKVGEKLKEFFEERVATASQLTGTDGAATMSQRSGQGDVVTREGEGSFSDDALSGMSDPMAKMLGASTYSARQRREFAERARKRMVRRAESIAKELHLDNVEVVTDVSVLPEGKKRGAKGFYSKSTGKITIVVPNHAGTYDIQQTVLHEAVAHYGLRQLFGTHFDTFLDNVFENVSSEIRNRIIGLARQNGWDIRTATEEYLAMLAEDVEFSTAQKSSWWSKIKGFFLKMLADAGVKLDFTLSDNELRYILWRSYQNLANPGKYASVVEQAADIAKQYDLKVGNYRDSATDLDAVAEQVREAEDVLFREDDTETGTDDDATDKMTRLRGVLGTMGIRVKEVESEDGQPHVGWSFLDGCLFVAKPEDIDEGVFFAGVANAIAFGKDIDTALGKENVDAFVDDVIADVFADFEGDADFDSALRDAGFDMRKAVRHYLSNMSVESYRAGGGFITYLENRLTEALRAKYGAGTFDESSALSMLNYLGREGEPESGLIDVMSRIASRWEAERERRGGEGSDSVASDRTDGSGSDGGGTSGDDHKITRGKAKRVLRESREERTARVMYEEQVEILGCEFHLHGVCKAIWDALKSKNGELLSTLKRNFKRLGNEWVEVAQDRTNAIRALQRAIEKAGGKALSSMEDVWRTLGALSSKNYAEMQDVHRRLVAPLIDVFADIRKKTGLDNDQIERYIYCKHALERNALMGGRAYEETMKKGYERVKALHPEDASSLTEREFKMRYAEELAKVEERAKKLLNKDYSGVKELLFGEKKVSHAKVTETAEQVVREFEKRVGTADVTQLWSSIKALTDFSLKKEYDCGLISKELYNEVREMYANYVPLRGWENDYAGDIFAYNKDGDVTDGIQRAYKKANGRKSQAKDILGHTIAMAHSAIACGNKNKAKQKFLFLAENHPSDLLLTSDMWYQIGADGKIEAVTADIHEDMSPEEVAEEIADFEERMKEAEKAGLAKRYKNDFGKELGLHMKPFQEKQHGVRVMVNGREHMVWVVGNPRAAMVLNGSLNDTLKHGWLSKFYSRLMRFQNSSNTSWNFNFVMGNVQRDFQTALNSGLINKGAAYAKKFTANYAKIMGSAAGAFIGGGVGSVVGGGVGTAVGTIVGGGAGAVINTAMGEGVLPIVGLMYRYNEGKLDMEEPMDRAFYEFAMNGGITGITSMLAAEEAQESFESEVDKKVHGGVVSGTKEVVGGLFNNIELLNNAFENATRFATFLTSREMGSSMTEAVMDAKEHSVNFNMRGTGAWSDVGWMIHTISFANAALQALRLNREWFANDWKKTTGVFLGYVAMGMTNAILMSLVFDGDDDDDEPNEDWYGLSRFNRYNNFNVLAGDGSVKVSIPHEFRAPFAIGNMMVDVYNGKISQRDAIAEIVAMPWNYSPVALVGPGTDITDLNDVAFTAVGEMLPSVLVKDVYDLWRNENYLGARIHNMSDYNKDVPEFQRTTKRTRSFYVAFSRGVNELLGGAYNRRSPVEWAGNNPGVVQYLVEQRIGGGVVAWANAFGAIYDAVDDEAEVDVYDIPFVKTIWAKGGKDNVFQTMVWNEFEGFQNSYIAIDSELRRNAKNTELTLDYKLQRIAAMEQNGELDNYFKFKGYNAIDEEYQRRIKAAQKDGDDDEVKRLREEQFDYRKHALSQMKDAVSTDTELLIRAERVRAEVQPFIERMSELNSALNKENARDEKDSEKIAALEAELDAISDPEILKKIGAYEDYLYYQREYESELKLGNSEAAEDARKDMLDAARLME